MLTKEQVVYALVNSGYQVNIDETECGDLVVSVLHNGQSFDFWPDSGESFKFKSTECLLQYIAITINNFENRKRI